MKTVDYVLLSLAILWAVLVLYADNKDKKSAKIQPIQYDSTECETQLKQARDSIIIWKDLYENECMLHEDTKRTLTKK